MKLGALNAAIDAAGDVYGATRLGLIAFKKGSLKDALRRAFPDGRGQPTGFRLELWPTPDGEVSVLRPDPDE